jgi:hypothetical protein
MEWLFRSVFGAVVQSIAGAIIAAVCLVWGFVPSEYFARQFGPPPEWAVNPLTRLFVLIVGLVLIGVWVSVRNRFVDPLLWERKQLVDRAFVTLPPAALGWLTASYASGRPATAEIGDLLYSAGLIDRDFVGWTEVKPELKALVGHKTRAQKLRLKLRGTAIMVEPWHIITLGLLIATAGVVWQVNRGPEILVDPPLRQRIDLFLKKTGKKAEPGPMERADNYIMEDQSDGTGPYISYWGERLGPWPTVADGFTRDQLRKARQSGSPPSGQIGMLPSRPAPNQAATLSTTAPNTPAPSSAPAKKPPYAKDEAPRVLKALTGLSEVYDSLSEVAGSVQSSLFFYSRAQSQLPESMLNPANPNGPAERRDLISRLDQQGSRQVQSMRRIAY